MKYLIITCVINVFNDYVTFPQLLNVASRNNKSSFPVNWMWFSGFVHVMLHVCHVIPCLSCDPAMSYHWFINCSLFTGVHCLVISLCI